MVNRPVLLIGWEGAGWDILHPLLDKGILPQLSNMVDNGVIGTLSSIPPFYAPMLWTTVATGKHPDRHGVVHETSSANRKCPAIWNILSHQRISVHAVGWAATHPAEAINGVFVSDAFSQGTRSDVPKEAVWPAEKFKELASGAVTADKLNPQLLGLFIPEGAEVNEERDGGLIRRLLMHLAELYAYHQAVSEIIQTEPLQFLCVRYRFLDQVCRDFMPFHAEDNSVVCAETRAVFKEVVTGAYRLQDLLLADLLKQVGSQVTTFLVSAHGAHDGKTRSLSTAAFTSGGTGWPRANGIFLAAGPGIKRDEMLHGAALADITPTILYTMGLPVGEDMDGEVLYDLFTAATLAETIPSWDERIPVSGVLTDGDEGRVMQAWGLGNALFWLGRDLDAIPFLEESFFLSPEDVRHIEPLIRCQFQLGMLEEAEELLNVLLDYDGFSPLITLARAQIASLRGDRNATMELLGRADSLPVSLQEPRGWVLLEVDSLAEAQQAFVAALREAPDKPTSWLGLAYVQLQLGATEEALESAKKAIQLRYDLADGHLVAALAHEKMGEYVAACTSFERAIKYHSARPAAQAGLTRCQNKQANAQRGDFVKVPREVDFNLSAKTRNVKPAQMARLAEWRDAAHERSATRIQRRNSLRTRFVDGFDPSAQHHSFMEADVGRVVREINRLLPCGDEVELMIRPPWPDELPRLTPILRSFKLNGLVHLRVLVTTGIERMVGLGAMVRSTAEENAEITAHLRIDLRPRFQSNTIAADLIAELEKMAGEPHSFLAFLPHQNAWLQPCFEREGYQTTRKDEFWKGNIGRMLDRVEPLLARIEQRLQKQGLSLRVIPLSKADPDAVVAMAAEHQLLPHQRVVHQRETGECQLIHDAEISCMVLIDQQPAGIMLVAPKGADSILFDVRAVAGIFSEFSSGINALMLAYSGRMAIRRGYPYGFFFSDERNWYETQRLAERCGCDLIGSSRFMKKIGHR